MMMLPEPTEVIPTKNPPTNPMALIPKKDCKVGCRPMRWSSIRFGREAGRG